MKKLWQNIKALFQKSDVEKTSLQKTARISIIFAGIAIIGVIVYFAVVAPLLVPADEIVPDLYEGEVYQYGAIYMLPQYDRTEIQSVEIKNSLDHYKLNAYTTESSNEVLFNIEGNEEYAVSSQLIATILGDVRILITNSPTGQIRVNEMATEKDLANYGLDAASDPAWFEVTLTDGTSYRVIVGKSLVTSSGYYAMLEGRKNVVTDENGVTTEYDIVYALQSSLSESVLLPSTILLSTEITPYYSTFTASKFSLLRMDNSNERKLVVQIGLAEEKGVSAASSTYEMIYPGAYVINEDAFGNTVLSAIAYINAQSIVAYGEKIHDPEVYEQFGLDLDLERLVNIEDKNHIVLMFNCMDPATTENIDDYDHLLYFSEKFTDLDGIDYYYVYSPLYEIIGKVAAENFEFLEWSVTQYTSPYMYFEYFTSAEYVELISERDNIDHRFIISGKEKFRHVDVTTSGDDGEIVYKDGEPLTYDVNVVTDKYGYSDYYGDFEIFRSLYYVLITRNLALYADVDESMTVRGEEPSRFVEVKTLAKDHPITYYKYDASGNKTESLRDQGGNIICYDITVPTTLSSGETVEITYDKAFYDEEAQKFFLKVLDTTDGYEKPSAFENDGKGNVKPTTFLPSTASGTYKETIYSYEFYDLYDQYVNADGEEVSQLNPTYMYVVPTTTVNTYRLSTGGEKVLIDTDITTAEVGVYIRTATIDKLYSDTNKLFRSEQIDTMAIN